MQFALHKSAWCETCMATRKKLSTYKQKAPQLNSTAQFGFPILPFGVWVGRSMDLTTGHLTRPPQLFCWTFQSRTDPLHICGGWAFLIITVDTLPGKLSGSPAPSGLSDDGLENQNGTKPKWTPSPPGTPLAGLGESSQPASSGPPPIDDF